MSRTPHLSAKLQGFGTTIFSEMTALAGRHGAVNLGQGFPDFEGPSFIRDAATQALNAGHNQYCRSFGIPELNLAIAEHRRRFYGLEYDPDAEVTVFTGATEALACATLALCDVGDEVVLFEPFYDSYRAVVAMAGAVDRLLTLRGPAFEFTADDLEALITPRTKLIVLNTPHNPTGKVFSRAELELVADACRRHDLLAVSDEVYEHLVFDGSHIPIASLPGMRERTVMISSTGKTFSFTGWKIGYACAPPVITAALRTAHQFLTFCSGTPFQHAMAHALATGDAYYGALLADYRQRRDRLCEGLATLGFGVLEPAGTYFACTDIRPLGFTDDVAFCRALPEHVGVAAIPCSAFYVHKHAGRHLVRWAFCKTDAVLDEALKRLRRNLERIRP